MYIQVAQTPKTGINNAEASSKSNFALIKARARFVKVTANSRKSHFGPQNSTLNYSLKSALVNVDLNRVILKPSLESIEKPKGKSAKGVVSSLANSLVARLPGRFEPRTNGRAKETTGKFLVSSSRHGCKRKSSWTTGYWFRRW